MPGLSWDIDCPLAGAKDRAGAKTMHAASAAACPEPAFQALACADRRAVVVLVSMAVVAMRRVRRRAQRGTRCECACGCHHCGGEIGNTNQKRECRTEEHDPHPSTLRRAKALFK